MLARDYLTYIKRMLLKSDAGLLTFFITYRCNLFCKHCFVPGMQLDSGDELSLREIEKFSENLNKLDFLILTGGEPFLRDDLPDIAECFYRKGRVGTIGIPSNGTLKSIPSSVERILVNCPQLKLITGVSLEGVHELHDHIRGKNTFKKAVKTYKKLRSLKSGYPNLHLHVPVTFNAHNQRSIQETLLFIRNELKPDSMGLTLIRGRPRKPALCDVDMRFYRTACGFIDNSGILDGVFPRESYAGTIAHKINRFKCELICRTVKENKRQVQCYAGVLSVVMHPEGTITACELSKTPLGNIRNCNYKLGQVLHSRRALAQIEGIQKSGCFCTHECNLSPNIMYSPLNLIKVILR